jgi:hypothetical protein
MMRKGRKGKGGGGTLGGRKMGERRLGKIWDEMGYGNMEVWKRPKSVWEDMEMRSGPVVITESRQSLSNPQARPAARTRLSHEEI